MSPSAWTAPDRGEGAQREQEDIGALPGEECSERHGVVVVVVGVLGLGVCVYEALFTLVQVRW